MSVAQSEEVTSTHLAPPSGLLIFYHQAVRGALRRLCSKFNGNFEKRFTAKSTVRCPPLARKKTSAKARDLGAGAEMITVTD